MDKVRTPVGDLDQNKTYDITLRHGSVDRIVKHAKVRAIEQFERIYDEEHIAIGKTSEIKYELTGMHQNALPEQNKPKEDWKKYEEQLTIGFLPEDVIEAKPSKMN